MPKAADVRCCCAGAASSCFPLGFVAVFLAWPMPWCQWLVTQLDMAEVAGDSPVWLSTISSQ